MINYTVQVLSPHEKTNNTDAYVGKIFTKNFNTPLTITHSTTPKELIQNLTEQLKDCLEVEFGMKDDLSTD